MKQLESYIINPEEYKSCVELAHYYYDIGHMSGAITFYLKAAERSTQEEESYACLLRCFLAAERLGGRNMTCLNMLQRAVVLLPERPEAHFLYARYHERRSEHQHAYTQAILGEQLSNFDLPDLPFSVEYPGHFGLMFEKAVSGYWWGKGSESRQLFITLQKDYWDDMDEPHQRAVEGNLERIGLISEKERDTDIVIQGPYREYTHNIVKKCLELSFVKNIIVSFWEDDNAQIHENPRVIYVRNKRPSVAGTDNRNLHIISTRNGLKRSTAKYCIKMRSDQEYDLKNLYDMRGHYVDNKDEYPDAIFTTGVYPKLLFHPRDHMFWGTTEQLKQLFDAPLESESFAEKEGIEKIDLYKHIHRYVRTETHLGVHYISRFDSELNKFIDQPEKYLLDNAPHWEEAHKKSEEVLDKYFRPMPRKGFSMYWHSKSVYYNYEGEHEAGERWAEDFKKKVSHQFSINLNAKPTAWIVDNFYEDPDAVREFALQQDYDDGGFGAFGRGYIGRRTYEQFLFDGLKERFENIMGHKIERWEEYGMNGRFQVCYAGEPLVYHCDAQKWAGMLYLTPDAPFQCGTTLHAHRKTKIRHNSDPNIDEVFAHNQGGGQNLDRTPYEPVDVLGNVYNRLVLFDAGCIHSASEYFGFNYENSRLWQMFFFD